MAKAKTEIRSLARVHTATAIATLAGIMRQKKASASARVAAAQALLDRGWGKPPQAIQHSGGIAGLTYEEMLDELDGHDSSAKQQGTK